LPANTAKTGGIERDNPAQHKSWRWFIFRRWALFGNVWSRRSFSLLFAPCLWCPAGIQ
jgi:hypothetical protein